MKSKVHFSYFCIGITIAVLTVFAIGLISTYNQGNRFYILLAIFIASLASGLYYCPTNIEAGGKSIKINRILSTSKEFLYSDISKIDFCYPSAGGIRICGSGGFFGYWGYFQDNIIGYYFGYYGDRSQCVLIRLNSGKQYVVSCTECDKMVEYLRTKME